MEGSAPHENEVMEHCAEILKGGYVQSFVEFLYLTNRNVPGESALKKDDQASSEPEREQQVDLGFVKEKLTEAEKARRSSDPASVFSNFESLALYFSENGEPETSLHFFRKCLKLAQLVDDVESEKRATHQLGLALAKIQQETSAAIDSQEQYLKLCSETKDQAGSENALQQLSLLYNRRAKELEVEDLQKSVVFLEKLLKISTDLNDPKTKASANFRLGKAFNKLGNPERAIAALTQSLEFARQSEDISARGESCAALADAYLQMEDKLPKAIEYLQETRQIASQNGDTAVQSRACRELGYVFSKCDQYEEAVKYYEQNFELVRGLSDNAEIDRARVLLGIALKNSRRHPFGKLVRSCNLESLLEWKVSREFAFSK